MAVREPDKRWRWIPPGTIPVIIALLFAGLAVWLYLDSEGVEQARVHTSPREVMANLTNADRHEQGLKELDLNRHVSRHAQHHTKQMVEVGKIFHSTPGQLRRYLRGFKWSIIGENVGVGRSLNSIEQAFMKSEPHRENILNPKFRRIAVGIVRTEDSVWVTVIYYG